MADTYRAWIRGQGRWQDIAVIDLRSLDGMGKRLQTAGLKTLGEIDAMAGAALLKLPGIGVGVVKRVRETIKTYKNLDRRRKRAAPAAPQEPGPDRKAIAKPMALQAKPPKT
jgi:hypothetical protein